MDLAAALNWRDANPEAVRILGELARESGGKTSFWALQTLRKLKTKAAFPYLAAALDSADTNVQYQGMLGGLSSPMAIGRNEHQTRAPLVLDYQVRRLSLRLQIRSHIFLQWTPFSRIENSTLAFGKPGGRAIARGLVTEHNHVIIESA